MPTDKTPPDRAAGGGATAADRAVPPSVADVADPAVQAVADPGDRMRALAAARASALAPGAQAPEFTLRCTPDQAVSLSDFRGAPVILVFYPADWSPVCGDQLALYNEVLGEFQRYGAELVGISVDGVWCHAAFAEQRHFHFPLLADFEPKGEVCRKYGVYSANDGLSNRALFVIDRSGKIFWSYISPMGVNPGADGILNALDSLTAAEGGAGDHDTAADTPRPAGRQPRPQPADVQSEGRAQ
jgi:peroxiredoxin